jgi:benzoylformate decarboxylase
MTTWFGNPGSTELPMFRDFPADFKYVLGLQESVVIGMADGFALAGNNAAFVNLHSSAGVGHGLGNLFTAFRNQSPIVIVAGQQARSILPFEPFLYAERATEFPRPFVKWSIEPARAQDVPRAILRAYLCAMQAPRGPTFVSVPVDDWDQPCEPLDIPLTSIRVHADPAMLSQAAGILAKAVSPVIVAGAGVAQDRAEAALIKFAETHHIPVWTAPLCGRHVFPEDHPLFQGFLTAGRESIVDKLKAHDVILVLGAPVFTFHVEGAGPIVPEGSSLIQIANDPAMIARLPAGLGIVGDLNAALTAPQFQTSIKVRDLPPPRRIPIAPTGPALTAALVMSRVQALRPEALILVEEAPTTREAMHDFYHVSAGEEFYTCASGGLGYGLPAAVGVAMNRPGRQVLALIGDGSAMYTIQGLWSAAQLGTDVRFLIINNQGYAALDRFARSFQMTPVGTTINGLDFISLAHGFGMKAGRVSAISDLDEAIEDLFAGQGPKLLEVMTERP